MRSFIILTVMIGFLLPTASLNAASDPCSPALRRVFEEEGFNAQKINLLCSKLRLYEQYMSPAAGTQAKKKDNAPSEPVSLETELDTLYRNGLYQEVKDRIQQANKRGEENPAFQRVLGKCLAAEASVMKKKNQARWKNNLNQAIAIAQRLLHSNLQDADALFIAGQCQILRGRPGSGMRYIRKSLKEAQSPKPEFYEGLGDGRMKDPTAGADATTDMDMREEAEEFYKQALELATTDFERQRINDKINSL